MSYVPYHKAGTITMLAGPCSIEDAEQMETVAATLERNGLRWLRGGAFKPRTSPYSFQGLGEEGLAIMSEAAARHNLGTLTEVVDTQHTELIMRYADAVQIGTRNMANFELLKRIGAATADKHQPVLYKRGMAATIDEWLSATEYLTQGGNPNIMLCERGIRTFETATRNTLDLSAVPVLHRASHLPVIVDPSHATGESWLVKPTSVAAAAIGADGVMIEVHNDPPHALCDGAQALTCEAFTDVMDSIMAVRRAVFQ
jgi:3-deoxy-7-phosphoheptulonate synthase